ncbi:hypothetical protein ACWKSP_16645 [Micromonosporaceae bacterium Da 78-11]
MSHQNGAPRLPPPRNSRVIMAISSRSPMGYATWVACPIRLIEVSVAAGAITYTQASRPSPVVTVVASTIAVQLWPFSRRRISNAIPAAQAG